MQLANEQTRLKLDGVSSTITADVTRRRDNGMIVTRALPFLKLDTQVTERGRRSRISRVAIAMDGDVPRLLLELEHDPAAVSPEEVSGPKRFPTRRYGRRPRTDHTVPYELTSCAAAEPEAVTDPPLEASAADDAGYGIVAEHATQTRPRPPTSFWRGLWRRLTSAAAAFKAPAVS